MPRMGKKKKEEWAFFLNEHNRITYNAACKKCCNDCKQSFRALLILCPQFHRKKSFDVNTGESRQIKNQTYRYKRD